MKNKQYFLVMAIFSLLILSSCKKEAYDPFKKMNCEYLTPASPISHFSVLEENNDPPTEGVKNFSVTFGEETIFSGKFLQGETRADYDILTGFVNNEEETGYAIWFVYVVSRPLYHSVFILVREDGQVIEEKIEYAREWAGGLLFPVLGVYSDGRYQIALRTSTPEPKYVEYIQVKF